MATEAAIAAVTAAIPADWRRGSVERADLPRFLFDASDIVTVVGQDGLVANVSKYLDGQPVLGFDPEPQRNPGILVPHAPATASDLFDALRRGKVSIERRAMVEAIADDGQQLLALNEIFVGHPSHQTARYTLRVGGGSGEAQASSGLIVATGTGATGWCRSASLERHSTLTLPGASESRLLWFVHEAWPSPATGTSLTEGECVGANVVEVTVASDALVAFGDGLESDALALTWGQSVQVRVAQRQLALMRA